MGVGKRYIPGMGRQELTGTTLGLKPPMADADSQNTMGMDAKGASSQEGGHMDTGGKGTLHSCGNGLAQLNAQPDKSGVSFGMIPLCLSQCPNAPFDKKMFGAKKPAPGGFIRRGEYLPLNRDCSCLHRIEPFVPPGSRLTPRNSGLISRGGVPNSSTNSRRVPHYHPTLVEIWTPYMASSHSN